jgi:hypothetical protein
MQREYESLTFSFGLQTMSTWEHLHLEAVGLGSVCTWKQLDLKVLVSLRVFESICQAESTLKARHQSTASKSNEFIALIPCGNRLPKCEVHLVALLHQSTQSFLISITSIHKCVPVSKYPNTPCYQKTRRYRNAKHQTLKRTPVCLISCSDEINILFLPPIPRGLL